MNSNDTMTELAKWREVMRLSATRYQADPNDAVAVAGLVAGRSGLRSLVSQMQTADAATQRREAAPGRAATAVMQFGQGASRGYADELAAVGAGMAPVPMPGSVAVRAPGIAPIAYVATPRTAGEFVRAQDTAIDTHRETARRGAAEYPFLAAGANLAGTAADIVLTGRATRALFPGVGTVTDKALNVPRTAWDYLRHIREKAALTALAGAETGIYAGTRTFGEMEGSPSERVLPAVGAGVVGGMMGAGVTAAAIPAIQTARAMRRGLAMLRGASADATATTTGAARTGGVAPAAPAAPATGVMQATTEEQFRAALRRMGGRMNDPAEVERAVDIARRQGRFGGQAPIETPTAAPATQAPSTQRTAPPEPSITSSEVQQAMEEGRAGLAAQRSTPVPTGPVETPAFVQRGATRAQLASRQGEIATRWLANPPTERAVVSIRALFANLPAAERESAMRAFLGNYAAGRVHPDWVPIINQIRGLP